MYEFKSRVRYSETDPDALLSYVGVMNYLQDCSIFHSEDCGLGVIPLEKIHRAWLLAYWDILIDRRPVLGEEIAVSTWAYDFKSVFGYRNFLIKDSSNVPVVKADSYWILTDTSTVTPVKVTEEFTRPYGVGEPRLDMEKKSRKIKLPADMKTVGEMKVMRHHLDTNQHVNNAQYVDIAREALPESAADADIHEIRVEYKKTAVLGDEMVLLLGEMEDAYVISLQNPEGGIFANVELKLS